MASTGVQGMIVGRAASAVPSLRGGPEVPSLAHRTDGIVLALAALDTALELIGAAVFVVDRKGDVLHCNATGHGLLQRDETAVRAAVAQMTTAGPVRGPWELVPIRESGESHGYLVLCRTPARRPKRNSLSEATLRWSLTIRQREVLNLVALGLTNADVGELLGIESCTVEYHLSAIFDKVGVDNRTTLIARLLDL